MLNVTSARAAAAGVLLCASLSASGCAESESCYDWVSFEAYERSEALERMASEATVVVDIEHAAAAGSVRWSGVEAHLWTVRVEAVVAGKATAGDQLRILSTPQTCSNSGAYPEGDPMADGGSLRLFMTDDRGTLRTLTPSAGVERVD